MAEGEFGNISSGAVIFLKAHTGKHIDIEGDAVQARYNDEGAGKNITIEKQDGGVIMHGDKVFLKAHTEKHLDVEDIAVQARWSDHGGWQTFVIEKESGEGALKDGDAIFVKTHTGKHLDVEDTTVRARFNEHGEWQKFIIEEEAVRRKQRSPVYDSDDDDDFFAPAPPPVEEVKPEVPKRKPGTTIGEMLEEIRKKLQHQLLEGMLKYAEQKYGRKKPQTEEEKVSTKEDYALYLNSLKVKAKQANTRLQVVLRQKKEADAKVDFAEKEAERVSGNLADAEEEKKKAEEENREPNLPATFVVPQRSKKAGATLGSLVMKASKKDWGAALQEFAASRRSAGGKAPEWAVKRNKAASILGAGKSKKPESEEAPALPCIEEEEESSA